jgi:hypothetical protein
MTTSNGSERFGGSNFLSNSFLLGDGFVLGDCSLGDSGPSMK